MAAEDPLQDFSRAGLSHCAHWHCYLHVLFPLALPGLEEGRMFHRKEALAWLYSDRTTLLPHHAAPFYRGGNE